MTAVAHTPAEATPRQTSPYRVGERVQILYMTERGAFVADASVTAVFPRADGNYGVNTVMSDARANFHLVPAHEPAPTITLAPPRGPGHVIYGVDHTRPTD